MKTRRSTRTPYEAPLTGTEFWLVYDLVGESPLLSDPRGARRLLRLEGLIR